MKSIKEISTIRQWFLYSWALVVFLFLYLPMILLCVYSFNSSRYATVWEGFSIQWYAKLTDDTQLKAALFNSLAIATYSTILSVILGTLLAIYICRGPSGKWRNFLINFGHIPLVLPDLVLGVGLLVLMVKVLRPAAEGVGLSINSTTSVSLSHATVGMAYVLVLVTSRLKSLDVQLEESASNLGARPAIVLMRIVLPQLYPVLASSALITFALSLDDFYLSYFTTAGGTGFQTLSIFVYNLQARAGVSPELNALSAVMLATSVVLVTLGLALDKLSLARKF